MFKLPDFLNKYFWGDDLNDLNLKNHKSYIAKILLSLGDLKAINWLHKNYDKGYLRSLLNSKIIDPKSRSFWNLYYSSN
jgi:hypothetical protein